MARPRPALAGTRGILLTVAFVMVLVAGILAITESIPNLDPDRRGDGTSSDAVVVLVFGVLAVIASLLLWTGQELLGGVLAVVAGIVFLVVYPDTAGLLALLGGILAIVAPRLVASLDGPYEPPLRSEPYRDDSWSSRPRL